MDPDGHRAEESRCPLKVTGKTVYGINVKLPGMEMGGCQVLPVYGGKVRSYDFERIGTSRGHLSATVPNPRSGLDRDRF
jgi:isoquinoline 1-oxidoreductase beta subunit